MQPMRNIDDIITNISQDGFKIMRMKIEIDLKVVGIQDVMAVLKCHRLWRWRRVGGYRALRDSRRNKQSERDIVRSTNALIHTGEIGLKPIQNRIRNVVVSKFLQEQWSTELKALEKSKRIRRVIIFLSTASLISSVSLIKIICVLCLLKPV